MYQNLFEQYDMDRDGFITMDENLEQDKVMADDQGKPFDEVWRSSHTIFRSNQLSCFLEVLVDSLHFNFRIIHGNPL
jgi:hypothetical protein